MGPPPPKISVLSNAAGVRIIAGGIFWFDFPPQANDPNPGTGPRIPYIGAHVGVIIGVQDPFVVGIYAETGHTMSIGVDAECVVDPSTTEGKPFRSALHYPSNFRDDSTVLMRASVVGTYIGQCDVQKVNGYFAQLQRVAQRGVTSRVYHDIRGYNPATP